MEIKKQTHLSGELTVPGDKSISHRAVMFGSLAQGTTKITHFLEGADCLSTISCFQVFPSAVLSANISFVTFIRNEVKRTSIHHKISFSLRIWIRIFG